MNMERYFYGKNIETQKALHEDGFDDGMVNYIHEENEARWEKKHQHNMFRNFFGSSKRVPAYQS